MTNYIAVIHKEKKSEFGVSFPDFPGCITAGKTIDEAKDMAQEALDLHIEGMLEDGEALPKPSSLDQVKQPDAAAYFIVTPNAPKSHTVRVNISMDEMLLEKLDNYLDNIGMTRSGFFSESAREAIIKPQGTMYAPQAIHAHLKKGKVAASRRETRK